MKKLLSHKSSSLNHRIFRPLALLLVATVLLGGCAGRSRVVNNDEYVEVDNPFGGDSPDVNAKIWVPRSSITKAVPRVNELVQKGLEKIGGSSDAAPVVTDAPKPPGKNLRVRLLVAEAGNQTLSPPLTKFFGHAVSARHIGRPSQSDSLTESEALTFLAAVGKEVSEGPVLFVSKPEGTKPGAKLKADLYDARGPLLIRSFWVAIPEPTSQQTPNDALLSALKGLADATLASLDWFTWYGKVISVNGDRIYLDAGRETGLLVGQRLSVYRGGEAIKGVGFAPGTPITSLAIFELFGKDGAIGTSPEAAKVQPGDYVELEKSE